MASSNQFQSELEWSTRGKGGKSRPMCIPKTVRISINFIFIFIVLLYYERYVRLNLKGNV